MYHTIEFNVTGMIDIEVSRKQPLERLKAGDFDVRIFASAYPLASIQDVSEESGIRLLSIEPEVRVVLIVRRMIPVRPHPGRRDTERVRGAFVVVTVERHPHAFGLEGIVAA